MELNELTYKINGAIFEVSNVLGSGFLEKVYENALLIELKICRDLERHQPSPPDSALQGSKGW